MTAEAKRELRSVEFGDLGQSSLGKGSWDHCNQDQLVSIQKPLFDQLIRWED